MGPKTFATATITAQNQFTTAVQLETNIDFGIGVSGSFTATVTLQRSKDGGTTWRDVETYTAPTERNARSESPNTLYRIGVKTGDFTLGTVVAEITQG